MKGLFKVVHFDKTGLSEFQHLQNVWHYFLEHGCYSYSPMHFASVFKVLIIEPDANTKRKRKEGVEKHEAFSYTILYSLCKEEERKPVETIPEGSHVHEWFKDIVLHDPMELLGSYADGKGKILQTQVDSSCIECACSYTLEEFEKLKLF